MNNKDECKRVLGWLNSQGFPLEMRVAEAFRKYEYVISQGEYFKDPTTEVLRELDVIACKQQSSPDFNIKVTFKFIIECKWSKSQPWVIFTSPNGCNTLQILANNASSKSANILMSNCREIKKIPKKGFINGMSVAGYGMTLVPNLDKKDTSQNNKRKRDNSDMPFKALSKVAVASYSLHRPLLGMLVTKHHAEFHIPLIVVEGNLFQACLSKNDKIEVAPIDTARVICKAVAEDQGISVDIVRYSFLEKYIESVNLDHNSLLNSCIEEPRLITDNSYKLSTLFKVVGSSTD